MISRSKQSRWLFPLLLLAPLVGCESRSRDTPSDRPQQDRDTVYTRTQTSPRSGGQGGADSSSPTPAEGGAVSGRGSEGSATTPGPGSQRRDSADLGRSVQRDNPQGAMGTPPTEQKGSSATNPQAGTGPTGSNPPTGSQGAMGTHPQTGSQGAMGTHPQTGSQGATGTQTGSKGAKDDKPPTGTQGSKGTTKTEPETHKGNPPATGEMGDRAR
ncbi:hypothetical protein OV090_45220 [Nannocystis sp. RBIL2]|uniref:hypothetical protein n=1 Tax=Nannocystis sp. RBIL2 TaxID=2996788 RepID=UPI00227077AC|nr:hypothetical protein [Nannocystis sp. RBIL2]MCY1072031.1 hypothetical protein [Nannocystis sp. RBIL2]